MASALFTLSNGVKMPQMGFGTWQLKGETCMEPIKWALNQGFQLLDTADVYENHVEFGKAVHAFITENKKSPGTHEFESSTGANIFVTTKVPPKKMGYANVIDCVNKALEDMGMSCVDLVLLHWPGSYEPWDSPNNRAIRKDSWKAMEQLYKDGKTKSIGVSNYYPKHLDGLLEDGVEFVPMVNQVEMHPFLNLKELEEWSAKHNMALQAYSSLGVGTQDLLGHPVVNEIAKELGCTPGQVLLKFGYQKNYMILPRTTKKERVKENWETLNYTLTDEHMSKLNELDCQKHYCWNPSNVA